MFTREEATAYSRNLSLLARMIPYKTSIQNEIVEQLTQQELMDIALSIKNETVINKLAKLAATYYKESQNNETLFCLSMTLATIIKEYEWGTNYLSADGICGLAQKICTYK